MQARMLSFIVLNLNSLEKLHAESINKYIYCYIYIQLHTRIIHIYLVLNYIRIENILQPKNTKVIFIFKTTLEKINL